MIMSRRAVRGVGLLTVLIVIAFSPSSAPADDGIRSDIPQVHGDEGMAYDPVGGSAGAAGTQYLSPLSPVPDPDDPRPFDPNRSTVAAPQPAAVPSRIAPAASPQGGSSSPAYSSAPVPAYDEAGSSYRLYVPSTRQATAARRFYGPAPKSSAKSLSSFTSSFSAGPFLVEFVSRCARNTDRLDREIYSTPLVRQWIQSAFAAAHQRLSGPWTAFLRRESNSRRPVTRSSVDGVIRIAVEDYPEIAEEWNISSLPTFLLIGPDGDVVARHEGMLSAEKYLVFLKENMPLMMSEAAPQATEEPVITASTPPVAPASIPVANMVTVPWTAGAAREPEAPSSEMRTAPMWREAEMPRVRETTAMPAMRAEAPMRPVEPAVAPPAPPPVSPAQDTTTRGRFTRSGAKEKIIERSIDAPTLWTIDLSTTPDNIDIDLEIRNENGDRIALGEAPAGEEHVAVAVAPGRYKIRVFSFRDAEVAANFTVTEDRAPLPAGRIVPELSGEPMTLDEARRAEFSGTSPEWLVFSAASPGRFKFSFDDRDPEDLAFDAVVYSATGEKLGESRGDAFVVETLAAGRLAVKLTPRSAHGGSVDVKVSKHVELDAGSVRMEIAPGQAKTGSVGGSAGLEKIYRIRMPRSGAWNLMLSSDRAGADIDLEVLKDSGVLVERSEGPTASEEIRVEPSGAGALFARVYVYRSNEPVPFTLKMEPAAEEEEEAPTRRGPERRTAPPTDATGLSVGEPSRGRVGRNETDWFKFEPERDGLYTIILDGGSTMNDIDLAVHAEDGEQLAISQNDHAREAVIVKLEAGSPVFIRVFAFQDSPGADYKLWIQPIER